MTRFPAYIGAALALTVLSTPAAQAMKVRPLIKQQGRLLDSLGNPATGTHTFTIGIYDHPTAGSKVKEVIREAGLSSDGLYDLEIGVGRDSLDITDFVDPDDPSQYLERWIEIRVDTDPPLPRFRLASVPYAIGAHRLAGDFFTLHNELMMMTDGSGAPLVQFKAADSLKEFKQWYQDTGGGSPDLSAEVFTTSAKLTGRRQHLPVRVSGAVLPSDIPGYEIVSDSAGTHAMSAKNSQAGHSNWLSWSTTDAGTDHVLESSNGSKTKTVRLAVTTSAAGVSASQASAVGEEGISLRSDGDSQTIRVHDLSPAGDSGGVFEITAVESGITSMMSHSSNDGNGFDTYVVTDLHASSPDIAMKSIQNFRASATDSAYIESVVDTSGAVTRMNKGDIISEIASQSGSGHFSLTDITAADQGEIVLQHNQTDLDFLMRHSNSAGTDTAEARMHADGNSSCWVRVAQMSSDGDQSFGLLEAQPTGVQLHMKEESTSVASEIHIKPSRMEMVSAQTAPSQIKVLLSPSVMEMTDSSAAGENTPFRVDRSGSPTGPTLTLRYPGVAGPGPEVFMGDLNGDAIPDLAVDGRVGVGTTSPSEALHVVGNACATGGHITCSDRRFKQRIQAIDDPMRRLSKLEGVEFEWRRDEFPENDFAPGRHMGFIAQDLQEIFPDLVSRGADGYLAVDYGRLTPLLVEVLKVQQARIAALERQVEKLAEGLALDP